MFWRLILIGFLLVPLRGFSQSALDFFTNRANALLQAQLGFGITNIPVFSSTNPVVSYSAGIHFALQSAANAFDQTTPETNFPSVFRPLFSVQDNALFIIGYTNVTTDFDAQINLGFKNISDPSIGLNDNVWGIPWVVGAKGRSPMFNEYSYSTAVSITRKLQFTRLTTNLPPQYTNQFYIMSVSNLFAAEAWNFSSTSFSTNASILVSNQVSILLTNNYNWRTNYIISNATNWPVASWPGSPSGFFSPSFKVPLLANSVSLPASLWSESSGQFLSLTNGGSYPVGDQHQTGWPQHNWTLSITNNLMYALLDNSTGTNRVLDFVNLHGLNSSLGLYQYLRGDSVYDKTLSAAYVWQLDGATDAASSPMSVGMSNQIQIGLGNLAVSDWPLPQHQAASSFFQSFLLGQSTFPGLIINAPFEPSAIIVQGCTWQAGNPWVHYTMEDLNHPGAQELSIFGGIFLNPPLGTMISNSVCNIGKMNSDYMSAKTGLDPLTRNNGPIQINFSGYPNLPYGVWGSTNLSDWSPLGTAAQLSPGVFQFTDPRPANSRSQFYQLRVP